MASVACSTCGCVYLAQRPSDEILCLAYAAEYAEGTGMLALPTNEGGIATNDPGYAAVAHAWYSGRATHALELGAIQMGDRVLELGSGDGLTLCLQQELRNIRPLGLECLDARAARAEASGISTQVLPLTVTEFSVAPVDVVQTFHHLQRVPDPLKLLRSAWQALNVGSRIIVEVPNVCHPYGDLEGTFLRPTDLVYFSESTLCALLRRAGFTIERTVNSLTLFVVGRKDSQARAVSDFSQRLLAQPEQDAAWISERLLTYAAMERLRQRVLQDGPDVDSLHQLVHWMTKPAFVWHVVDVVLNLVEFFMTHQAVGLACLTATAASQGPYEAELTDRFARLAQVIRDDGVAAVGLLSTTPSPAAVQTLQRVTRQEDATARSAKLPESRFRALLDEIRGQLDPQAMFLGMAGSMAFAPHSTHVAQA
jgi:SAM-dependent methyltransferase